MSIKYYEIKSLLRSEIKLTDSLMNKFFKYMLLYGIILIFSSMGNINDSVATSRFFMLIFFGVLYRFNVLFERINIKNLSIYFQKSKLLTSDQTSSLISEIELSLDKINGFANWSCGILATISIFAISTFINFF